LVDNDRLKSLNHVNVKKEGLILEKTDLFFEDHAVLNPACIKIDEVVHMFYRAVRKAGMISSIGYCKLKNNVVVERSQNPILVPEYEHEQNGIEDPRIVCIEGTYILTHTMYDGHNVLTGYATTTCLPDFKKRGYLLPKITFGEVKQLFKRSNPKCAKSFFWHQKKYIPSLTDRDYIWIKNAVFFPRKINGKFVLLHRILPGIHLISFDHLSDLKHNFWHDYLPNLDQYTLFYPRYVFENHHIAPSAPPIETDKGWIFIYHAAEATHSGLVYRAAVALLDLENPQKVLGRLTYPLFGPEEKWERLGAVNNIVFPTAAIKGKNNRLYIYYGGADSVIGCRSVDIDELLQALIHSNYDPTLCCG